MQMEKLLHLARKRMINLNHISPQLAVANFLVSTASPMSKITGLDLPV